MDLTTKKESQAEELQDDSSALYSDPEYNDDKNQSKLYEEYSHAVGELINNVQFNDDYSTATTEEEWKKDMAEILQERDRLAENVQRLRAKCVEEGVSLKADGNDEHIQLLCWTILHPLYAKYDELRSSKEDLKSRILEHEEALREMRESLDQVERDSKHALKDCLDAGLATKDGRPNDETMLELCRNVSPFNIVARFMFPQYGRY
ncbi:hypothetical protein O988_02884 [Pseudogymnoascus sp. VKM F-3808]|nr:hypothetical protein O988_02884 [Pseudogymnoascus sp. VKM F-3808]